MYFSIAPVEIATHMSPQFTTDQARRPQATARAGVMRHRMSSMLRSLASKLEPAASAR